MLTKRYIVIFAGLGPEKYREDILIKTWEDVADKIYLETGIYISARLAMSYMICGDRRGCDLKGPTAEYTSVWNPVEVESEAEFHKTYIRVVKDVRKVFDNPYMGISIEEISLYYFLKL